MTKVYIAAKFRDRMTARYLMAHLRGKGHTITVDWTTHEKSEEGYPVQFADDDLRGIDDCDMFIGVFVKPYRYKGALVELGAALALEKKVCVIGDAIESCIFYYHPDVTHFKDIKEFLENGI